MNNRVRLFSETVIASTPLAFLATCSQTKYDMESNRNETQLSAAAPRSPVRIFQYSSNFQVAFDARTRNPVYVIERLVDFDESSRPGRRKRPRFFSEPDLSEHFRSRNSHYQGTSYDRGHMAPAGDFVNDSDFMKSFVLTNTSPQDPTLNRNIWAQLEAWTRRTAQNAAATGW